MGLKFYTVTEAAEVLRVTEWEVTKRCRTGLIKASKPGKSWLIAEADLLAYIESHSNQAASADVEVTA